MDHAQPRPFRFDTVFGDEGVVIAQAPRPKRAYTPEEVEVIRAQAYREGETSATSKAAEAQAQALAEILAQTRQALTVLAKVAHDHRAGSAELALACARAVSEAALEKFPTAALDAALQSLSREVEAAPRLIIRIASADVEIEQKLESLARNNGYPGQIVVKVEPGPVTAGFLLDWGEGQAVCDPEGAQRRVAQAIAEALEAEGLHAEPLIPDGAPPHGD